MGACMGVVVGGAAMLPGSEARASQSSTNALEKLEQENQELKGRLDVLEDLAKKEGLIPSSGKLDPPVSALSEISLSGFVTASFFHDSTDPQKTTANPSGVSPGYLWNRESDNFTLNKVKITLASPQIQNTGDKFDAGFRVSMIMGQDAPIVNTQSGNSGDVGYPGFNLIREAFIEFNIPIGSGLDVRAGELISLLNYESGDGGAVNANFSQGYQWFFTGNPPETGVQVGYKFTDVVSANFRVVNGMYSGETEFSHSKTLMGSLNFKPFDALWFNLLGFGGRQDAGFAQSLWGASLIGGFKATDQLGFGTEFDYFNFHNPSTFTPPGDSPVWSAGLWTTYDFTPKIGVALRGEYLDDHDGVDASGGALGFENPGGTGQNLADVTLTLNWKPVPSLKIQPEIRWDHTSYSGGFVDGKQNRFIFGAGVSYLY